MSTAAVASNVKKEAHSNDTYGMGKHDPIMENYREIVNPMFDSARYVHPIDDNRRAQGDVLKEKTSNNNILSYDKNEWLQQMNEVDIMNATKDFDVKDVDDYTKKLAFTNANGSASANTSGSDSSDAVETKVKNKTRTQPEPSSVKVEPWSNSGAVINNNSDYDSDSRWESNAARRRSVKLPITPFNIKGILEGKRAQPRVPLYSSQSPRMSRIARSSTRNQEQSKARSNSTPVIESPEEKPSSEKVPETKVSKKLGFHSPQPVFKPIFDEKKPKDIKDINLDDYSSNDDDDDDLDNVSELGEGSVSNESSDSEEGYRAFAYKLTHSTERPSLRTPLTSEASEEDLTNPESLLAPSLFPNVPPYLSFSTHLNKGPEVHPELQRLMKWRISNVMPKVVRSVLANSGMRLVKKTNDWMGVWGKHMKAPCFRAVRPYQKINHLPGSFKIGRKDSCWRNLQKQMNRYGKKEFGFMPRTYIIPYDLAQLRKAWPRYSQKNVKWIIKPPASARGTGIRVVNRWAQIPKRRPLIVQKYIERPLLINGSKFDLRLYVLVTSINPLRVFMYHNGLARFASVKYSDKAETLNDRCMHLTNYSINKLSSNYSKNEDVNACSGHKWTLKSLWTYLGNRGVRTDCLWEALRNLVLRTIMAGENSINNMIRLNVGSKYSCFELFGFDVLLDSDLIPWLLEVNISPSLHSELPLDAHVKAPLVQGVLNTALYNIPPKLSIERQRDLAVDMSLPPGPICYDKRMYINYLSRVEKIKHNTFTRKSMEDRDEYINAILENLTPDDVRCLVIAEDELARCSPLERIFPTSQTYKYLRFTDMPRYYNRLLDAWETRYGNNRAEGIALLRSFCEKKYHLDVPPPPAKKPITYRTRTLAAITKTRIPMRSSLIATYIKKKNLHNPSLRKLNIYINNMQRKKKFSIISNEEE